MPATQQRSDEWFQERAGLITASDFKTTIIGPRGSSVARDKLIYEKAAEIVTGAPKREITARALEHGRNTEDQALAMYQAMAPSETEITKTGLVPIEGHPVLELAGASPDALVGEDGGLEIKCPHNSGIHLMYLRLCKNGEAPKEYVPQIQGGMFITGRSWWDFMTFDPSMPPHLQSGITRIERDDEYINEVLEPALVEFQRELFAIVGELLNV